MRTTSPSIYPVHSGLIPLVNADTVFSCVGNGAAVVLMSPTEALGPIGAYMRAEVTENMFQAAQRSTAYDDCDCVFSFAMESRVQAWISALQYVQTSTTFPVSIGAWSFE